MINSRVIGDGECRKVGASSGKGLRVGDVSRG